MEKFRIANQRLFLTYSQTSFDKKEYEEWLKLKVSKSYIIKFIRLASESHKDGNRHMHVLVDFGKNFQTTNVRYFDYNGVHPNIKKVTDSLGWINRLHYIGKEDPENQDLFESSDLVYRAANANNALEAMALGIRPMDAKVIHENVKRVNFELEVTPEPDGPVYRHIQRILDPTSDLKFDKWRTVHWFYDQAGCSDKTKFAKYAFENKDYCIITSVASVKDFTRQIDNAVHKEMWTTKCLVVCLPRTFENREGPGALFDCIEMAKDGIITANKYDSHRFRIRGDVTVIVLANCLPDEKRMTSDRWQIWHVGVDKSVWSHGKMQFYDGPDANNRQFPQNFDGPNNQPSVNSLVGTVVGFQTHDNHEWLGACNNHNAFGLPNFPVFSPPKTEERCDNCAKLENYCKCPKGFHNPSSSSGDNSSSGVISSSSSGVDEDSFRGGYMNLKVAPPETKLEISNDPNWINSETLTRASAAVFTTPKREMNSLFDTWQG